MTMALENIRMALTSLKANKSRALLTMLGIIIGVAAVIAIMTVGNSVTGTVESSMQSMGVNNVNVMVQPREQEKEERENGIVFGAVEHNRQMEERDYVTDEMIQGLLEQFPDDIEAISASETVGTSEVKKGDKTASVTVTGVSQGYCWQGACSRRRRPTIFVMWPWSAANWWMMSFSAPMQTPWDSASAASWASGRQSTPS